MTRDYRRGSPPPPPIPKPPKRQRSCVWWFLLGNLVGGLGVGTVWMFDPEAIGQVRVAPPAVERPAPAPPSFEFPRILRDTEVEIGGDDSAAAPPSPPSGTTTTASAPATSGGAFLVQAGAFRRAADAERLKAQLALLGVQTRIHTSTAPGGETWHRVRAGPYPDRKTAEQAQALLKRNNQDSVILTP